MWEITLNLYIVLYILPLIMFGPISRYGHRLLMPAMGAVFVLSFTAYIDILGKYIPQLKKKDTP
ncbi:MAG: hypothetical protein HQK84_08310 [Nitrospinae bacterium]|nr:hypothetical protein [Nitrospinota bacterium]